jgi:dihydroorotate dehydrogenase electron transfer subunit
MYLQERVVENRLIGYPGQGIYKLVLYGQVAKSAKPGQFVHLRIAETYDPLLRRPLSIAGINREREEVTIYYRVAGKGTELLTRISVNEQVNVLGPLGTGFTIPQEGELLLIAGGIGVFPLYSLIQALSTAKVSMKLLWGGENQKFLESADLNYLKNLGIDYEVSTMDGSLGYQGLVTDLLEKELIIGNSASEKEIESSRPLRAAACGPRGMLKAVTAICLKKSIPIEVSLEERMACGIGACLGCVCTVKGKDDNLQRKRVCKEGPVFDGEEVVWDAEV